MGDTLIINSAKEPNACKVKIGFKIYLIILCFKNLKQFQISIVSNVTTPNQMKVFLFRNYNLSPTSQSHYEGTTKYKVWEAVRASSAAPGYYEDFKLDGYVFHVIIQKTFQ